MIRIDMKRKACRESGQAMVEFILIFPILILIIMGCIEFSWYLTSKYSLNQYASVVGHNVQKPFWINWSKPVKPGDWVGEGDGRKPSWLTAQEKSLWSFDEYDGWYAFTDPAPGDVIGSNYFMAAYDSKAEFKKRLEDSVTVLDKAELSYTMKGGWYINAESLQMPKGGGGAWNLKRSTEKIELHTADIRVDMVYHYKPITPLGEWLFCRDGADYIEMRTEGRYIYNLPPSIYG
ncbi:TadE/TadG family type IV pilus assembly protein [Clostridium sp. AN503]|uniref:TadE/TadG family type IV pilus assembly protein n=1 Tax=Clostridium sp. AN503 TaxID=3160598 RepID=UPI00345A1A17